MLSINYSGALFIIFEDVKLILHLISTARRFDFFDVGMMDILQYRLEKAESVMSGRDVEVTFKGSIIGKRRSVTSEDEYKVTWSPSNM